MTDAPNAPRELRDRRPGLIGCGIVYLLFGVMFIGFCLLMVLAFSVAPPGAAKAPMPAGMVAYTSLFYLALAALFLTLGLGSIMARRWAPPLILVVSWGWLVTGIATGTMMGFLLPRMMESMPSPEPGAKGFMAGCMTIGIALFGIALPLVFVLFYRSAHVKATVERLDPVPRWTDRQPVAMLIFASWMFFGAVSTLLSSFMYRALPVGSFMLRGWQVFAVMAIMATLLFWIGVGTLRRLRAAWWSAVLLLIIGAVWSALMTSTDPMAMSEAMGVPPNPQQMQMMEGMYSSPFFIAWMAIFWSAYLAFLLYLRRYFFAPSERPAI